MMDIDTQPTAPQSHYEYIVLSDLNRNSTIQQVKTNVYGYMDQLEGWCSKNKAAILIDLIFMLEPSTVVEIGVFGGKSLVPMAAALKVTGKGIAYGIDPWDRKESADGMEGENYDWWSQVDHGNILRHLQRKIVEFALEDQIELFISTSESASEIPNIDILHIDGNHSEKAANLDVRKWVPLVRKGGVIIFDDVNWGTNRSAVEWLDAHCIRMAEFHESSDWAMWIQP